MNAIKCPFQQDEAHFLRGAFFDELAEDGEMVPALRQGVPLPKLVDLEGQKSNPDEIVSASAQPPRPSKSKNYMRRRNHVKRWICVRKFSWRMARQHLLTVF